MPHSTSQPADRTTVSVIVLGGSPRLDASLASAAACDELVGQVLVVDPSGDPGRDGGTTGRRTVATWADATAAVTGDRFVVLRSGETLDRAVLAGAVARADETGAEVVTAQDEAPRALYARGLLDGLPAPDPALGAWTTRLHAALLGHAARTIEAPGGALVAGASAAADAPAGAGEWSATRAVLDAVAGSLEGATDAPGAEDLRRRELVRAYRSLVLEPVAARVAADGPSALADDELDAVLAVLDGRVDADWDVDLPGPWQLRSWLLRGRRLALLHTLEQLDRSYTPRAVALGAVWVSGVLHVRTAVTWTGADGAPLEVRREGDRVLRVLPAEFADVPDGARRLVVGDVAQACLTLRARGGGGERDLPTRGAPELADDGSGAVPLRVVATGAVDPATGDDGAALAVGPYDVRARASVLASTGVVGVTTDEIVRPAIVKGRTVVAYRSVKGALAVEVGGRLRSTVKDGWFDVARATVASRQEPGGHVVVDLAVPLEGVRPFPVIGGKQSVVQRGRAELVAPVTSRVRRAALKVRRRLGWLTATGDAVIEFDGEDLVLKASATAGHGLWQVVLTLDGVRRVAPLLVSIGRDGTVEVTATPGARTAASRPTDGATPTRPRVSIVMAVYNAGSFVEEAVRSAFDQTVPAHEIEIVAVDDGSVDDSLAILRRLAAEHPNMRVISQENSGSAAVPRNVGIDAATGRYLFFLDADDRLTRTALEKMLEAAEDLDAQVVLGRMEGFGAKRAVPRTVFKTASADADMVENSMILALGPTKLFDADHVRRLGLRFATGLRNGEDMAFVAEAELAARRRVILTDTNYYMVRGHDDELAVHMSASPETIDNKIAKARLVTGVIERYTEPGPRREALLTRPFGAGTIEGMFRQAFDKMDDAAKDELVNLVADEFGHLWTPGLRDRLVPQVRPVLELVFRRDTRTAAELVRHAGGNPRNLRAVVTDDGLVLDVPQRVVDVLGADAVSAGTPPVEHLVTAVDASAERVEVEVRLHPADPVPAPTSVVVFWRRRGTTEQIDGDVETVGSYAAPRGRKGIVVRTSVAPASLPATGLWDLWAAPVWGPSVGTAVRLGAKRAVGVDTDAIVLGAAGVLYGTQRFDNLSIDRTGTVVAVASAELVELRLDEDGRPEMVVRLPRGADDVRVYATVDPAEGRDARHRLPWRALDDARVAARLPVPVGVGESVLVPRVAVDGVLVPVVGSRTGAATSSELAVELAAAAGPGLTPVRLVVRRTTPVTTPDVVAAPLAPAASIDESGSR